MKLHCRCAFLFTIAAGLALLLSSMPAKAAPAYRAGWSGAINYNASRWHFWKDTDANKIPEWGVYTGPIAVTNRATGYVWNLKGYWNSDWYSDYKPTTWGGGRCWRFWGQMYFDGSTYYFGEKISWYMMFSVDGTRILNNDNADDFNCAAVTPAAGWHDVELRCGSDDAGNGGTTPPGAIENGADGYLLGFGYAKTSTAPTGIGGFHYPYDTGSGTFLRSVAPADFFTVDSFSIAGSTYTVSITAAQTLPGTATACLYLGDANAVAENGSEATWTVKGSDVSLSAGQSTTVSATWTGAGTPFFAVKIAGALASLDKGYAPGMDPSVDPDAVPLAGSPQVAFWQWSDPAQAIVVPNVTATFTGVTGGTQADFSVVLGYDIEVPGVTPDIAVTAYYGAADAGTVAADWTSSHSFGDKAVGTYALSLPGLTAGESYYVRFAVQTQDSDLVWSAPLFVSLAGVNLSGLSGDIYENYPVSHSFTVNRPANAVDDPLTVHLAYSGDTNRVTALPASVTLAAGSASTTVSFVAVNNADEDGNGSFTVRIAPDSLYVVGTPDSLTATVVDDETAGGMDIWTGSAGDGRWETAGNWSLGHAPTVLDTAVFQYAGFSGTRAVTISTAATAAKVRLTSGDALAFSGSGSLTLGGIDRNGNGWPFGTLEISVPLTVFAGEGGTNVWDVGQTPFTFNAALSRVGPACVIKKAGSGKLTIQSATSGFADAWHIAAGEVDTTVNNGIAGAITIGGEDVTTRLTQNGNDRIASGSKVEVLDKGTLYSNGAATLTDLEVYKGGLAYTSYCTVRNYLLHGGTIQKSGSWADEARPNGQNYVKSFASDTTAYFSQNFALNNWWNAEIAVEDGAAPVDLVFGSFYQTYENAQSNVSTLKKTGAGTLMVTTNSNNIINRDVEVVAGTWLADAPGSGTGHRKTLVKPGATLGGVGRILGSQVPNTVNVEVTGNSGSKGAVAPGSIDPATGDHVFGTLTVGAEDCENGVSFGVDTRLRIRFGEQGAMDRLVVYGPVNVNAQWTTLELAAEDYTNVRGGEYEVVTATGGISNPFANVVLPHSNCQWTVHYNGGSLMVRVPGLETILLLR